MSGYGFGGGRRVGELAPMPQAQEVTIRAQAQSLLSRGGRVAPLPTFVEAQRIIRDDKIARGIAAMEAMKRKRHAWFAGMLGGAEPPTEW